MDASDRQTVSIYASLSDVTCVELNDDGDEDTLLLFEYTPLTNCPPSMVENLIYVPKFGVSFVHLLPATLSSNWVQDPTTEATRSDHHEIHNVVPITKL
jgi:hypothetical protein